MNLQKKTHSYSLLCVLLLGTLGLASSGCVDTSNEVSLYLPLKTSCKVDNGVLSIEPPSFDDAVPASPIMINVDEAAQNGALLGVDDKGNKVYAGPSYGWFLSGAMKSNMRSTTSHASLGAGHELRIDQNTFLVHDVTYEIVNDIKGLKNFKIEPKKITGRLTPGSSLAMSDLPFLSLKDLNGLKKAMGEDATLSQSGTTATLEIKAQVHGELNGGSDLSTESITFPVRVCLSGCTQSTVCEGTK